MTAAKPTVTPRLILSSHIGDPPYILDPKDLPGQYNPLPDKLGTQLRIISPGTVVKYGRDVRLAEAEAMHFVSQHTSIVCPKLEAAYILDGVGYIIMTWEEGECFDDYWDRSSDEDRERVVAQLQMYVAQMRESEGQFIGGVDRSACEDGIFMWDYEGRGEYGPYESEQAFNEGICDALDNKCPPLSPSKADDMSTRGYNSVWTKKQLIRSLRGHKIVFSHGDLHVANMRVRRDGTVVLLDWGLAGFWPEYWEFYRASFKDPWRPDFVRQIERFIPPFYAEAFIMRQVNDWMLGP